MFSLRIVILLALLTRIENFAVSGYIPFNFDNNLSAESTTPETTIESEESAKTSSTPVIETTTAPTFSVVDEPRSVDTAQLSIVQQNATTATASCICKPCKQENGYFIKHFRQYNYYYPNGQKVTQEMSGPEPIIVGEMLPNFDVPVTSTISMTNNNGRMKIKSGTRPSVRYNPPVVASYVPNNGLNYIFDQLSSGTSGAEYDGSRPTLDQKPDNNEESTSSDESSSEQTNEPAEDTESATSSTSDPANKDSITYHTAPNAFGKTIMTVKNDNSRGFQSQQISVSSRMQSKDMRGLESQQQGFASAGDDNQNIMAVSYNPYYQPQQFSMPSMLQPQPETSVSGYQSSFDFLGGASQIYQPNAFQYYNPLRGFANIPPLPPSPLFDYPNLSSYSVFL